MKDEQKIKFYNIYVFNKYYLWKPKHVFFMRSLIILHKNTLHAFGKKNDKISGVIVFCLRPSEFKTVRLFTVFSFFFRGGALSMDSVATNSCGHSYTSKVTLPPHHSPSFKHPSADKTQNHLMIIWEPIPSRFAFVFPSHYRRKV